MRERRTVSAYESVLSCKQAGTSGAKPLLACGNGKKKEQAAVRTEEKAAERA